MFLGIRYATRLYARIAHAGEDAEDRYLIVFFFSDGQGFLKINQSFIVLVLLELGIAHIDERIGIHQVDLLTARSCFIVILYSLLKLLLLVIQIAQIIERSDNLSLILKLNKKLVRFFQVFGCLFRIFLDRI